VLVLHLQLLQVKFKRPDGMPDVAGGIFTNGANEAFLMTLFVEADIIELLEMLLALLVRHSIV
jgi:hypothetical protein